MLYGSFPTSIETDMASKKMKNFKEIDCQWFCNKCDEPAESAEHTDYETVFAEESDGHGDVRTVSKRVAVQLTLRCVCSNVETEVF
jgi:hypothetical protein